jgi:hypothetical protein
VAKRKSNTRKSPGTASKRTTKTSTSSTGGRRRPSGDFGVPASGVHRLDRAYVSRNTKRSDPGAAQPLAWEHDGRRDHGAGAPDTGPGSASGGNVDTDVIGVGTGGSGISASGPDPDAAPGPDDNDGTSNEYASPLPKTGRSQAKVEPARGRNQTNVGKVGGAPGRTFRDIVPREPEANISQGADAVTNPNAKDTDDDSFVGEVSSGEARGEDNPMPPSSDTPRQRRR